VRAYLVERLKSLGLEPEVQSALAHRDQPVSTNAAFVHNIVARLPGTASSGAIMLMAHYDSVSSGPGASDDGAGVVAILETVRALQAGEPLKNDLIVLLTDGEELGLLGAQAFADDHPWMKEVALVINLEARGSSGGSMMFETSGGNGRLVAEYARVAARPVTTSLFADLYKQMPNDTDLTVFLEKGVSGLNFAYGDNWSDYHTGHDSLTDLDVGSLQHHGENALYLARHFGTLRLDELQGENRIFFSLLGLAVLHYPRSWALPLAGLVLLLFVGVVAFGLRRERLSFKGMALGAVASLLSMVGGAAIAFLGVEGLQRLEAGRFILPMGASYHSHWYEAGFVLLFGALTLAIYTLFRARTSTSNLLIGATLWWLLLSLLLSALLPGGSYPFVWPLLVTLLTVGALFTTREPPPTSRLMLAMLLPTLLAVVLVVPVIYVLMLMLGAAAYVIAAPFVVLLLALLLPYLKLPETPRHWAWPAGLALVGVALLLAVSLTSDVDAEHPDMTLLFYHLNSDTQEARWVNLAGGEHAWSEQFLGEKPLVGDLSHYFPLPAGRTLLEQEAPVVALAAPEAILLDEGLSEGRRTLRLQLRSPRRASRLFLFTDEGSQIQAATLNGEPIQPVEGALWLTLNGVPAEGVELEVQLPAGESLGLTLMDGSWGLPQVPGIDPQRPATLTSFDGLDSSTLVARTVTFAASAPTH
jgi:hypothetical protein